MGKSEQNVQGPTRVGTAFLLLKGHDYTYLPGILEFMSMLFMKKRDREEEREMYHYHWKKGKWNQNKW